MSTVAVDTVDLTRFYGSARGIEGLTLRVETGEVFGFLGPNGAGKTTTIRLLLDLIRPTRGQATILGRDCRRDSVAVRRRIGYLPGEYSLYENLTGRQLLAFLGGLRGGFAAGAVDTITDRLAVELDRPIRTLSHGNKQKLALLVAFAPQPDLLILDEPTTGLDPLVRQEFYGMVEDTRRAGRTVFLSSHDLTEVERMCDRVASVRDGRLIDVSEVGSLRERTMRIVEMTCIGPPEPGAFADLTGVTEIRVEGRRLRCRVRGAMGELIAAAQPFGIADLLSREPSLEELFLALYGRDEGGDHAG